MRKLLISAVRFYQRAISAYTQPHCRFIPTCSNYMIQSIQRFGPFGGVLLGLWRILRCNPFCRGGYDPVPEKFPVPGKALLEKMRGKLKTNK